MNRFNWRRCRSVSFPIMLEATNEPQSKPSILAEAPEDVKRDSDARMLVSPPGNVGIAFSSQTPILCRAGALIWTAAITAARMIRGGA